MRAGRAARWAGGLALGSALFAGAAEPPPAEVRVLSGSGPQAPTTVTVRAEPETRIEDRTPGAKPAVGPRGPASAGETFTGELTIFLGDYRVPRPAAIDVDDPVVSTVRLFPEADGTTVSIFVRQPVTYSVSRPSGIGDITIELRGRTRALGIAGVATRGRPHVVRPKGKGKARPSEVAVDAQSLTYERETNTLVARGGVTLTRGDTTLTADEVRYDRTNAVAEARGHVVITDPEATVEGDFAHLNLDDESGWVEAGTAELKPSNYRLTGARIDKRGGPLYAASNGVFTTCRCGGLEKPSWSIAGATSDITLEGTGVVRHATFRVKDIPVLYFPYFLFPAKTDRQSGFLFPRLANSNRRGFQYEQPFFWAINKSTDATVAVDLETAARVGVIGEYRYLLSRTARGNFTAAYYNEQIRGRPAGTVAPNGQTPDIPENRFAFSGQHRQPFYGGSQLYLRLFAISDDAFLKEINTFAFSTRRDLALRSTRFTTSRAGIVKSWDNGLAWVETAYYQDLIDPQPLALQKLPRLEAEHAVPLLGDLLVGRLDGQAIDYQRERGYGGLRGDLGPELFLPFHLGRALNGSLTGRLRETAYHLTDTEQVAFVVPSSGVGSHFRAAPELPRLDADRSRELAEVSGRTGTEFARVFDFRHFGLEKLKHTVEPELRYLFVPDVSRPIFDERILPRCHSPLSPGERPGVNCGAGPGIINLPSCADVARPRPGDNCGPATLFSEGFLFDDRDAINRRNFLSYGITTRLLARAPTPAEAAAREVPAEAGRAPAGGAREPVEAETLAQGLPAAAVPDFVGPPAPPSPTAPAEAPAAPPRELVRASVLHGYDISRPIAGTSHASDTDLGLRLTPVDYLGLSYNATVNLERSAVRGQSIGLFLREPWWTAPTLVRNYQTATTVGISYRVVEGSANRDVNVTGPEAALLSTTGLQEVDGSVYLRLGNYVGFTFLSRYDLLSTPQAGGKSPGPHFLERDYALRLISRCNCWLLEAGVQDKTNPDERLFRVQFTLVGLGSFGRPPLRRNYVGFAPLADIGFRRPGAVSGGQY